MDMTALKFLCSVVFLATATQALADVCGASTELIIENDDLFENFSVPHALKVVKRPGANKSGSGGLVSRNGYVLTAGHIFLSSAKTGDSVDLMFKPSRGAPVTMAASIVALAWEPNKPNGLDFALLKIDGAIPARLRPISVSHKLYEKRQIRLQGFRLTKDESESSSLGKLDSRYNGVFTATDIQRYQGFSGTLAVSELGEGLGVLGGMFRESRVDDLAVATWFPIDDENNNALAFQSMEAIVDYLLLHASKDVLADLDGAAKIISDTYLIESQYRVESVADIYRNYSLETLLILRQIELGGRIDSRRLMRSLMPIATCLISSRKLDQFFETLVSRLSTLGDVALQKATHHLIDYGRSALTNFQKNGHYEALRVARDSLDLAFKIGKENQELLNTATLIALNKDLYQAQILGYGAVIAADIDTKIHSQFAHVLKLAPSNQNTLSVASNYLYRSGEYAAAAEAVAFTLPGSSPSVQRKLAGQYVFLSDLAADDPGDSNLSEFERKVSVRASQIASGEVLDEQKVGVAMNQATLESLGESEVVPVQVFGKLGAADLVTPGLTNAKRISEIAHAKSDKVLVRGVSVSAIKSKRIPKKVFEAFGID